VIYTEIIAQSDRSRLKVLPKNISTLIGKGSDKVLYRCKCMQKKADLELFTSLKSFIF